MFCMSVTKGIAGMIVTLGGVDAIVFTGGIGEHDATVRATIGSHLGSVGIQLATNPNNGASNRIDAPSSRCEVHVLPSLEDDQIARHTSTLLASRREEGALLSRREPSGNIP